MASKSKSESDSNLMAALSYLWLLSVVMLLVKKDDPYVLFHAKQGLVIFIASFLIGWIPVLNLIIVVAVILGFVKAIQGEKYKLPLVGDLAEKINI